MQHSVEPLMMPIFGAIPTHIGIYENYTITVKLRGSLYYTTLHCAARNTVERCIGLLKAWWRCLLVHRVLHYDPHMVAKIINACAVLHNLCNRNQIPAPVEYIHVEANREVTVQAQGMLADANEALLLERGQQQRATIIQRLWHARGE
nr:unnamed protein product [Callosobruchus analis]